MEMSKDYHVNGKTAFIKAAEYYALEAEIYDKNKIEWLAKRASVDKTRCQCRAMDSAQIGIKEVS
jgi:hypothetical protein